MSRILTAVRVCALNNSSVRSRQTGERSLGDFGWLGWVPLVVLTVSALAARNALAPWQFMGCLSLAIFAGLKWVTWWRARRGVVHARWRSIAYLLAWPGMDAKAFLDSRQRTGSPSFRAWAAAIAKTVAGALLIWAGARIVPPSAMLLRGWIGMLGLILLLHFGSFGVLALSWQTLGVNAKPIMTEPLRSESLSEFWGKRWNLGFRQLSHDLIFQPLRSSLGPAGASLVVFIASGLIHDLVISLPARGGYGLPTAYFVLQGLLVLAERSPFGRRLRIQKDFRGWLFAAIATAGPCCWLFHPLFVRRVILPFMEAIHAI